MKPIHEMHSLGNLLASGEMMPFQYNQEIPVKLYAKYCFMAAVFISAVSGFISVLFALDSAKRNAPVDIEITCDESLLFLPYKPQATPSRGG